MRCPKCGYNSFDHFDSCKKCGNDLIAFKQSYGIKSVLFPGEMSPAEESTAVEVDNATADAAVTAATVPAKTPAPEPKSSDSDSDDFGFDFMGDSAEDDDLSFDELFEEAPEDEDIEETIEGPQAATEEESQLDDDFGFDPVDDVVETLENDFSFDDEELESISKSEDAGIKEDPQRPFDLPESLQDVEAPEASLNNFTGESSVPAIAAEIDEIVTSAPDIDAAPERYVFEPIEASEPNWEALPSTDEPEPLVAVAPPQTSSDIAVTTPTVGTCVGAFIYDLVILITVGICFIVAAEAAMSMQKTRLFPSLDTLINLSVPYFLVLFFLSFGYFTLFHFLAGQTPGKMLTGVRVETIDGEPLAFAQAFLRSVGGLLQLLPVGIGYLLVLIGSDRRGWNDKLAGTRVVVLPDLS